MLQVERLTKRYGERVAVNAIGFGIGQGETVGLLGPNGAGKTTAIAMISGISRPDDGEVRLGGMSLAEDAHALKRRVGPVPQDLALYEELSAWANLQLFGGLYGLGAAQLKSRAKAALAEQGKIQLLAFVRRHGGAIPPVRRHRRRSIAAADPAARHLAQAALGPAHPRRIQRGAGAHDPRSRDDGDAALGDDRPAC